MSVSRVGPCLALCLALSAGAAVAQDTATEAQTGESDEFDRVIYPFAKVQGQMPFIAQWEIATSAYRLYGPNGPASGEYVVCEFTRGTGAFRPAAECVSLK